MNALIETFKRIGNISVENEILLMNSIRKIHVPAKTNLQEQNSPCKKIYFVEKGIARTFYLKDGKDITHWIATDNEFVGSISSFLMQDMKSKSVETISDCTLYEFEHSQLEELLQSNSNFEKVGRSFAYYGLSLLEKRFDDLHFNTAIERYRTLINKRPDIIKTVPLGIIASYLGISQETLSRIRSQV